MQRPLRALLICVLPYDSVKRRTARAGAKRHLCRSDKGRRWGRGARWWRRRVALCSTPRDKAGTFERASTAKSSTTRAYYHTPWSTNIGTRVQVIDANTLMKLRRCCDAIGRSRFCGRTYRHRGWSKDRYARARQAGRVGVRPALAGAKGRETSPRVGLRVDPESATVETMSEPVRVLLVEDHQIVREGLRALLEHRSEFVVVAEGNDGHAAVELVEIHRPHVVVMDLNLPGLNGVHATKQIRARHPATRVLILSMYSTEDHVRPAIRAGAAGYLLKGSGLSDLVAAISAVAAGNAFFSPQVARIVLEDSRHTDAPSASRGTTELTPRERQILKFVADGHSSPEIASELQLSVKTVEGHRSRIMSKLDTKNVAGLVRCAIRMGIVSSDT